MSASRFAQPILTGGLRLPSFFNGRLLAAEDLSQQQDTLQLAQQRLGMAVGAGVAFGLEVSEIRREGGATEIPRPILQITKGLAVNLAGQTLWLDADIEIPFLRPLDSTPAVGGSFQDCGQPDSGLPEVSGIDGAYILTVGPAEAPDGLAPVSGLGNRAAVCSHREIVQGVQFQLKLLFPASQFAGAGDRLRNRVAYACFGIPDFSQLDLAVPTPVNRQPGVLDTVRPGLLSDCEVPLAILYWTAADNLQFVDMWAVRRRVGREVPMQLGKTFLVDRRLAEGESMMCQFQGQLSDLLAGPNPEQTRAVDWFRHLPPLGMVPLSDPGLTRGFHEDLFLDTIVHHPVVILEGARVQAMIATARQYPPTDLDAPVEADRQVMIWLYRIREIEQRAALHVAGSPSQRWMIFDSGHTAYLGDPHFDVNRWDFSNWI